LQIKQDSLGLGHQEGSRPALPYVSSDRPEIAAIGLAIGGVERAPMAVDIDRAAGRP
jgi:hypothetical protein